MQLVMEIYKVDEEATKAAVEKFLKQAREYAVTEYIPEEASVAASYSDLPRRYTGQTSDQTARLEERYVDEPERRRRHVERAERAISRLGHRQQKLIRIRYMDDDDVMDFDAAQELGFNPRHYRRIKSEAIYRLATSGLACIAGRLIYGRFMAALWPSMRQKPCYDDMIPSEVDSPTYSSLPLRKGR